MPNRDDPDGDRYFALRTFRRDGTAVVTPIWLAPAGDRWYGYTPSRSWKVTRLRANQRVEVAPANFHGAPHGPWRTGTARVLPRAELRTAKRALTAKYGNAFRYFTLVVLLGSPRRRGGRAVGLEIDIENMAHSLRPSGAAS